MRQRFGWIAIVLALVLVVAGCGNSNKEEKSTDDAGATTNTEEGASNTPASYDGVTVKIGVQGKGGLFGKAQEEKWFEDAFGELGAKVEWVEFQSGPPMIEAMASNHLDFAGMGNMPPISAQAAGIDFTIISQLLDGKNNVAIIVPTDSSIKSIADLKGKKVAVTKGSNAYNFLYRVLDKAGLSKSDIEEIQLQPDETQPSFEGGKVDAWAVWDPYISLNTLSGKARVLADGESEGVLSPSFQLVRSDFAKQYPDLVTLYLKTFEKARQWEAGNQDEAFQRYADERSIPLELIKGIQSRSTMINIPVSDETIADQQKTADFQLELGTIRKQINVADVFDNQYIEAALK
ncbi:sulfonate transport system substrate-binding protein [Paenibacillus cellulosilyticus]|uniref:Putative aliphatic sulfonates-binding protein n=1 Tax=Paenibacillus cellulosilyticus TaxID=375489 RepID=A0A2V2Z4H9_9BACL|nr:aliphatic sulfonate ABC transporter substrate-binding protein [Paenibacillus cellulosilyticus]PWW08710.1 sulfonate transport system substrate-binding protein [Paenibacillus cellulosilyticus]QKS48276.1 aliphatic sulfonate ABC transporter substrate-binding protein [Paenibacillus cellulosilyticus]